MVSIKLLGFDHKKLKKLTKVSFILILFTIFGGNLILGSSFDCNNANTIREQTICNDPQLSKLDREIGVTFESFNKKGNTTKKLSKDKILGLQKQSILRKIALNCTEISLSLSLLFQIVWKEIHHLKNAMIKSLKLIYRNAWGT